MIILIELIWLIKELARSVKQFSLMQLWSCLWLNVTYSYLKRERNMISLLRIIVSIINFTNSLRWKNTFCYVTTCKKHRSIYQERSFRLISFFVAARRITTSSSRVCRLLLASYDSQSSMIIILRYLSLKLIFVHKKRFEQKDLSKKQNDRSRRVTSSTRRRVVVDS